MTAAYLTHITINTGDVRARSPRSEVGDDIIAILRPVISSGGGVLIADYGLVMIRHDAAAVVYDVSWQGIEIVRCWLCLDQSEAPALWTEATSAHCAPDLQMPSDSPWLAAGWTPEMPDEIITMLTDHRLASVLGPVADLERCVAWAVITAIG